MKALFALGVAAVGLGLVACSGGPGQLPEFDPFTGQEPAPSGQNAAPVRQEPVVDSTESPTGPVSGGEDPEVDAGRPDPKDSGTTTTDAGTSSGTCSGTYSCDSDGQKFDFVLQESGGRCTASGLIFSNGKVTSADGEQIGTYTSSSATISDIVCPRTK